MNRTQAMATAPVWWLQGQAPSRVALPLPVRSAVVYLFEDSQSCLSVDGLIGGGAHLSPGEWLCSPVQAHGELALRGIRDLRAHGVILALEHAEAEGFRHLFSKSEMRVAIGPGWRVRLLAGSLAGHDGPCTGHTLRMFDVFIEPGALLQADEFAGMRLDVIAGELLVGGKILAPGAGMALGANETTLRTARRSHALLTYGLRAA